MDGSSPEGPRPNREAQRQLAGSPALERIMEAIGDERFQSVVGQLVQNEDFQATLVHVVGDVESEGAVETLVEDADVEALVTEHPR